MKTQVINLSRARSGSGRWGGVGEDYGASYKSLVAHRPTAQVTNIDVLAKNKKRFLPSTPDFLV